MSELRENTRFTVAFGVFTGTGPTYTGQVQTIGSTGFTVNDINLGDGLYDGSAMYRIDAVNVTTPGSIATVTVTYQAGDTPDTAPAASRGQITKLTGNLGLALMTQVGSNFMTPDQLAKLLTSNFIKIDAAITGGAGGGQGENIYTHNGTLAEDREVGLDGHTLTFQDGTMTVIIDPANNSVKVNGADLEIGDAVKGIIQSDGTNRWRKTIRGNGSEVKTML